MKPLNRTGEVNKSGFSVVPRFEVKTLASPAEVAMVVEHVQHIWFDIFENEQASDVNVFYFLYFCPFLNDYISLSLAGYVLITAGSKHAAGGKNFTFHQI